MGKAYSQDLRDRVIAARDRGLKTGRVAELFRVSSSWVRRVMQRRRETGQTTPRPRGGATVVKIDLDRLRQLVREQPDATTRELIPIENNLWSPWTHAGYLSTMTYKIYAALERYARHINPIEPTPGLWQVIFSCDCLE